MNIPQENTKDATKPPFFRTMLGKTLLLGSAGLLILLLFIYLTMPSRYVWTNDAYLEAYNVQISSDLAARITKIHVDEGDFVKKGDLIVELEDDILQAKKVETETAIRLAEEIIGKQWIAVKKAEDDYKIALDQWEKNIIPFIDYDHKEKDFLIAKQMLVVAEKSLENAVANLGIILAKLDHTKIVAPRSGYIAKRWILPGDVAIVGQPLFVLNQLNFLWVKANLEETKMAHVKEGNEVVVTIDSYPSAVFRGKVWTLKPSTASRFALIPPSNATGNFTKVVQRIPIKIQLDLQEQNKSLRLFPGMSCEVNIKVR